MNNEKYYSKCGREIKQGTRTKQEIIDNINKILSINVWDIKCKKMHLIKLEKAIVKSKSEEKNE